MGEATTAEPGSGHGIAAAALLLLAVLVVQVPADTLEGQGDPRLDSLSAVKVICVLIAALLAAAALDQTARAIKTYPKGREERWAIAGTVLILGPLPTAVTLAVVRLIGDAPSIGGNGWNWAPILTALLVLFAPVTTRTRGDDDKPMPQLSPLT